MNQSVRMGRTEGGAGKVITLPPSAPKAGTFPLLTARADGLCCIETRPLGLAYGFAEAEFGMCAPEPGAVFATALYWYVSAGLEPFVPATRPVMLKPEVMTSWSEQGARIMHAYVVDCFDRALLEIYALQEAGMSLASVGGIRFGIARQSLFDEPVCASCGGALSRRRRAHYCGHCGATC